MFVGGISLYSLIDEFSYFPWFRWYAGYGFWGFVWLLFLLFAIFNRYQDYQRTPLLFCEFVSELHQLHRILDAGLDGARQNSEELIRLCDDLEDAVRMTTDPRVAALRELGSSFLQLKSAFESLADLEGLVPQEQELLASDLRLISSSIEEILDQSSHWGDAVKLKKLRISPFLRTYSW